MLSNFGRLGMLYSPNNFDITTLPNPIVLPTSDRFIFLVWYDVSNNSFREILYFSSIFLILIFLLLVHTLDIFSAICLIFCSDARVVQGESHLNLCILASEWVLPIILY